MNDLLTTLAYDPWAGTQARAAGVDAPTVAEAPRPLDAITPPSLALHARLVADGAAPPMPSPAATLAALQIVAPATPIRAVEAPSLLIPALPRDHDSDATAAQFATLALSRAKLDRVKGHADRLGTHAAEVRARLASAFEHQVAAAIGTADVEPVEAGPLRGELLTVERQLHEARGILADVAAEHVRHERDLAALCGADGAARARLAEAQDKRAAAQSIADAASALLSRAKAHEGATSRKLEDARAAEARHDAAAAARLRDALADGDALPTATEPFVRLSGGLEDDLRAAQATVRELAEDHVRKGAVLNEADRRVRGAVDAVMLAEADVVAREVVALDARAILLRARLRSFTARPPGDYIMPPQPAPVRHPGGWLEAALIPTRPLVTPSHAILSAIEGNPDTRAMVQDATRAGAAGWDAFAAALSTDADAEMDFAIEPPPPPVPIPSPLPHGRFPASWEAQPDPVVSANVA